MVTTQGQTEFLMFRGQQLPVIMIGNQPMVTINGQLIPKQQAMMQGATPMVMPPPVMPQQPMMPPMQQPGMGAPQGTAPVMDGQANSMYPTMDPPVPEIPPQLDANGNPIMPPPQANGTTTTTTTTVIYQQPNPYA